MKERTSRQQPDQTPQNGGSKSPEPDLPGQAEEAPPIQRDRESLMQLAEQDPNKFARRVIEGLNALEKSIDHKNRENKQFIDEIRRDWGPIGRWDSMQKFTATHSLKHQGYALGLEDALQLIKDYILVKAEKTPKRNG